MNTHESAENYLETILILHNRLGSVRSVDIVNELSFTRPSVSVAMKKLREGGQINMDKGGRITLTESGLKTARRVLERHTLIAGFLTSLGVDEKTAAQDACRIEHVISEQSYERILDFVSKGFKAE